jgi:hypothetical protein
MQAESITHGTQNGFFTLSPFRFPLVPVPLFPCSPILPVPLHSALPLNRAFLGRINLG